MLVLWLGFLTLVVMGFINAVTGKMKPVPVLGDNYQKWFSGAFE
jgi:hypothetical protein